MNSEHLTDWLPGILALAASTTIAVVYLFGSRRLKSEVAKPESLDDFDARYQLLLAQLKEHLANKHLLPATQFEAERQRLEQAAAQTLRTRDGKRHEEVKRQARAEKQAAAPATFGSKHPALVGGLIGGAVVAFFAFLGYQLMQSATERKGDMQATGTVPPGAQGPMGQAARDEKLEQLANRVQSNPGDVDAVAALSMLLIRRQAFEEAQPLIDRTTLLDPYHPKGRVGRAVMRALQGDVSGSIDELETLGKRYPEAYDAHMFAGMLALETKNYRRALVNLETYVALAPASEQAPMMTMAVTQLKQQLAAQPP